MTTNSEARKAHESRTGMKIVTYSCFAPATPEAHLAHDWTTLGAPGCTTAVRFNGTRKERIALLTAWAEAEGCTILVGELVDEEEDIAAAAFYGGVSGRRTFD